MRDATCGGRGTCGRRQSAPRRAARIRSARNPFIADEVAAADHFREVLRAADERDHVERGVGGAADPPFLANRRANRGQGDQSANPGYAPAEPTREPPTGVLSDPGAHRHTGLAKQVAFRTLGYARAWPRRPRPFRWHS